MDKVFQINLAGVIFTIEENAFQQLNAYLNALKAHFSNNQEVVSDIEARMAELFTQKTAADNTIFKTHVDEVIGIMGSISDLSDEEPKTETVNETNFVHHAPIRTAKLRRNPYDESLGGVCSGIASFFGVDPVLIRILFVVSLIIYGSGVLFYLILWVIVPKATGQELETMLAQKQSHAKKLFRDPDNRVIAGVSGGLSNYFGIDNVWIRLFFVVSLFAFGTGFWLYIIMWVITPKAITTTDKLLMRGQNPTISNIHKEFNETGNIGSNQQTVNKNRNALGKLLRGVAKLFIGFVAFILFLSIISLSVAMVAVYFGMGNISWLNQLIAMTVDNQAILWSAKIGILLTLLVPLVGLLIAAIKILFKVKINSRNWLYSLIALFVLGNGLLIYAGTGFASGVSYKTSKTKHTQFSIKDTLYINGVDLNYQNEERGQELVFFNKGVLIKDNQVYLVINRFKITKTYDDSASLQIKYKSNGRNYEDANFNLKQINYKPIINNNVLTIPQHLTITQGAPFRWQEVGVELQLPENTIIVLDDNAKMFVDESNIDQADGNIYQMKNGVLICLDCNGKNFDDDDEMNINEEVNIEAGPIKIKINDKDDDNVNIKINGKDEVIKTKKVIIKNGKKTTIEETKIGPVVVKRKITKEED